MDRKANGTPAATGNFGINVEYGNHTFAENHDQEFIVVTTIT
jgi:hypothetical protein